MDHSDDGLSDKDFPLDSKDIELIQLPKGSIYLIGTAHVSKASVELAKEVIQKIRPRSVAVELCETRWKALQDPERWKKMDVVQAIRQGRGHLLLSQLLLAAFQKKLGALTEVKPGTEMLVAALTATDIGADLVLADRSIRTTLKRVWRGLGFFSAIKVLSGIIAGLFAGEKVTPDDIERLKDRDVLSGALEDFS
jgi:pheromone shutdown-related protein TraB